MTDAPMIVLTIIIAISMIGIVATLVALCASWSSEDRDTLAHYRQLNAYRDARYAERMARGFLPRNGER